MDGGGTDDHNPPGGCPFRIIPFRAGRKRDGEDHASRSSPRLYFRSTLGHFYNPGATPKERLRRRQEPRTARPGVQAVLDGPHLGVRRQVRPGRYPLTSGHALPGMVRPREEEIRAHDRRPVADPRPPLHHRRAPGMSTRPGMWPRPAWAPPFRFGLFPRRRDRDRSAHVPLDPLTPRHRMALQAQPPRAAPGSSLGQPLLHHAPQLRRHLPGDRRGRSPPRLGPPLRLPVTVAGSPGFRRISRNAAGDPDRVDPASPGVGQVALVGTVFHRDAIIRSIIASAGHIGCCASLWNVSQKPIQAAPAFPDSMAAFMNSMPRNPSAMPGRWSACPAS